QWMKKPFGTRKPNAATTSSHIWVLRGWSQPNRGCGGRCVEIAAGAARPRDDRDGGSRAIDGVAARHGKPPRPALAACRQYETSGALIRSSPVRHLSTPPMRRVSGRGLSLGLCIGAAFLALAALPGPALAQDAAAPAPTPAPAAAPPIPPPLPVPRLSG